MSKDYLHIPCSIPWLLVMIPSAILSGITCVHTHDGGLTTPGAIPQDGRIQNTTFHSLWLGVWCDGHTKLLDEGECYFET